MSLRQMVEDREDKQQAARPRRPTCTLFSGLRWPEPLWRARQQVCELETQWLRPLRAERTPTGTRVVVLAQLYKRL